MLVVVLTHPQASVPEMTGAKAANIARCARAGLATLPGFALTTEATARGIVDPEVRSQLRAAWVDIGGEDRAVVVRSSSTIEDAGASSMAGRFTSVLDVTSWDELLAATQRVIDSADAVRDEHGERRPIAVLVQPQLDTGLGGVMFGVDPVTGQTDRVVVEAVATRPDALVSGMATADHYVLSHRGRVLAHATAAEPVVLDRRLRRRLVEMAAQAAAAFGSPQDVEWAVDREGRLWLLQSRPVTAVAAPVDEHAVVLGAGPVAETFPAPLTRLEQDLWIGALRDGIVRAVRATGAVSESALAASPVVTTVDGWAAVDLELLGLTSGHTSLRRRLSPAAILRRLSTAWRVGRLRVALPRLAATVVATVDRDLEAIGRLDELPTPTLLDLLDRSRAELATVHSYEVLCGMLLRTAATSQRPLPVSATGLALEALATARRDGTADDEAIATDPVLLSLVPPSTAGSPRLPAHGTVGPVSGATIDELPARDALRLRARWLQELQCRIARRVGERLAADGALDDGGHVVHLDLGELAQLVAGRAAPPDLGERARHRPGPPLPTSFRIGANSRAITADRATTIGRSHGLPAGGGRGIGVVVHELGIDASSAPGNEQGGPAGRVLVTQHLTPQLAALLPQLAGLVSETGSALSHVAILARELGVPTVAGLAGARARFAPGTQVVVDGTAGTVDIVEEVAA